MHPHHNVIFLFISSSNESVYQEMRGILQILFDTYKIKYFSFFISIRNNKNQGGHQAYIYPVTEVRTTFGVVNVVKKTTTC